MFKQHTEVLDLVSTPGLHFQRLTNLRLDRKAAKERAREQAHKLFHSIHALSKEGMKNAQISRTLGIHRHTVEKYLAFKAPPQRRYFTKKVSAIAPYEDYILKRWKEGCRNAMQIHREISEQGYPGAYQNVGCESPAISRNKNSWENPYRLLRRVSPLLRQPASS